jgi:threonyl-tRNA synthetase
MTSVSTPGCHRPDEISPAGTVAFFKYNNGWSIVVRISRLFETYVVPHFPGVETPGYWRLSLWDMNGVRIRFLLDG